MAIAPADLELAETPVADIAPLVARGRDAFDRGATRPVEWRRATLERLRGLVVERTDRIQEALAADLGKPGLEGYLEHGVVPSGLRVQGAPQAFDGEVQGIRARVAPGAAEQHVLHEVGQPVLGRALHPGSTLGVKDHCRGVEMVEGNHHDSQAIVEGDALDGHAGMGAHRWAGTLRCALVPVKEGVILHTSGRTSR